MKQLKFFVFFFLISLTLSFGEGFEKINVQKKFERKPSKVPFESVCIKYNSIHDSIILIGKKGETYIKNIPNDKYDNNCLTLKFNKKKLEKYKLVFHEKRKIATLNIDYRYRFITIAYYDNKCFVSYN